MCDECAKKDTTIAELRAVLADRDESLARARMDLSWATVQLQAANAALAAESPRRSGPGVDLEERGG